MYLYLGNEEMLGQHRTTWDYSYRARELLPFARRKYEEYRVKESAARERLAVMIKNPVTFHDDRELQEVKGAIDRLSGVREQLEVQIQEFRRNPERELRLHLSDVVSFGIHLAGTFEGLPDVTAAWRRVTELEAERTRTDEEIKRTVQRQERLARHLPQLRAEGGEATVRERFVRELDRLQDHLDGLESKLDRLRDEAEEARRAAFQRLDALPVAPFALPSEARI